jgi:hypothetical protein
MPGGDRTGPAGLGPMTGRGAGYCAGYPVPGYMNPVPGRGYYGYGRGFGGRGRGRGGGRGWRNWYYAAGQPGWAGYAGGLPAWGGAAPYYAPEITPEQETEALKKESEYLKQDLKDIEDRIKSLEKQKKGQ